MNKTDKILIINLTRLGDILQSAQLLRTIKLLRPQAEIHFLAVQSFAEVCRMIPQIDRIIPFEFTSAVAVSKSAIRDLPRRLNEVEAFIESLHGNNYDQVINLSHSRISALLCHLLAVPDTRGLTLDREGFRQILHPWAQYFFTANLNRTCNRFNLVDVHLGLAFDPDDLGTSLRRASPSAEGENLCLAIPLEARNEAVRVLQDWPGKDAPFLVGFQPGASLPSKRWPAESFIQLGQGLIKERCAGILIFGSKEERELAGGIASALGDSAISLAGKTSLATLAAVLNRVNLLVSNDTGTQHLAAAMRTPVLSLCFGSALSHETGPYGVGHIVVESTVPCFPCSFHVECKRFRCQEQTSPRAVARLALNMLTGSELVTGKDRDLLEDLNVWRTDFDTDGFWIQRPVVKRPLTAEVLINLALRKIWKDILTNQAVYPRDKTSALKALTRDLDDYLPPDPQVFAPRMREYLSAFMRLEELALSGEAWCDELERVTLPPINDYEKIQTIGDDLVRLDLEIAAIGASLPAVNHFVLDYSFGKQNLEGWQAPQLARQTAHLYRRLIDGASCFRALLEGWESVFHIAPTFTAESINFDAALEPLGNSPIWISTNT